MPTSIPPERPVLGVVLAAGRGERLRPVTDRWAKPVLPFLNRPLLGWTLDRLARAGLQEIGVNAWHLAEQVVDAVAEWGGLHPNVRLACRVEAELLGTGGGARGVWEHLGRPRATVVVVNGDVVTDVDLRPHLERHWRSGRPATLVLAGSGEGGVWVDAAGGIVRGLPGAGGPVLLGGAARQVSFVGISFLEPAALGLLPAGPGCLLRQGLTPHLLAAGGVGASFSDALHLDVGTPARYWEATRRLLPAWGAGQRPVLPAGTTIVEPVLIDESVHLEGPARLGPWLVAGGGVQIAAGSEARRGVVWGGVLAGTFEDRLQFGELALGV